LIELLVVIAILGILAAIAIPRLGQSREVAKISAHNANVRTLKSAAAMYIAENPGIAAGTTLTPSLSAYLDGGAMPENPTGGAEYVVELDSDGNIYVTPGTIEN